MFNPQKNKAFRNKSSVKMILPSTDFPVSEHGPSVVDRLTQAFFYDHGRNFGKGYSYSYILAN